MVNQDKREKGGSHNVDPEVNCVLVVKIGNGLCIFQELVQKKNYH